MIGLHVHGLPITLHRLGEGGGATPVLCLGSTGMSGLQWRRVAKALARRGHPVYLPDLIGYGGTPTWPGPGPFETRYDIDVVDALLVEIGAPVHLIAHSYGGRVGLAAGLRDPARLRSLSLFEPTCFGVLRSAGELGGLEELHAYDHDGRFLDGDFGGTPAWVERFVDYWSGPGSWADNFSDEERALWLASSRKMFEEVRETALDELPHTRYVEAFAELPALLLSGSESTLAGRRCAEILASQLPHGRHIEIEGEGHMAPLLAAAEVSEHIVGHIAEADPSAPARGPGASR